MGSPFEGAVLDPVKCSKLSMEERREIVYELENWSQGAADMLQSWSRQDILQILCAEMGKERKYTGLTKLKMIEHLLKVVSEKKSGQPSIANKALKRPRKPDNPSRFHVLNDDGGLDSVTHCINAACKARLSKEYKFCKRCTCCICHKYDDNKDPSLWLTCSSDPPFVGDSCNMSCHLECALKHERSGIARNGVVAQLDGSFYCVSCAKMNDLMRCWRKQLMVAKDTRRVDILCYRVSLSQKLLSGTRKYQELSDIVDDAVQQLEAEVGTLTGVPVKMGLGRGIVNRLSSGQEVQRLCASAVSSFDSMVSVTPFHQDSKVIAPSIIRVEDIGATSVTVILGPDTTSENNVGYTLWHHKADDNKKEISQEPTCTNCPPQTRFIVSELYPATQYIFRVVSFANTKELTSSEVRVTTTNNPPDNDGNCSSLSNPSSVEDETNNIASCSDFNYYNKSENKLVGPKSPNEPVNSTNASQDQNPSPGKSQVGPHPGDMCISHDSEKEGHGAPLLPCTGPQQTSLPVTPSRLESMKDGLATKKGEKRGLEESRDEECVGNGNCPNNLEYYIKVVRWLECGGHIEKSFRQKFLTWYSIRATPQETRIVKAFVDTLIDDPASLSEQLLDTFGEMISTKRSSVVTPGFCLKLWH